MSSSILWGRVYIIMIFGIGIFEEEVSVGVLNVALTVDGYWKELHFITGYICGRIL